MSLFFVWTVVCRTWLAFSTHSPSCSFSTFLSLLLSVWLPASICSQVFLVIYPSKALKDPTCIACTRHGDY